MAVLRLFFWVADIRLAFTVGELGFFDDHVGDVVNDGVVGIAGCTDDELTIGLDWLVIDRATEQFDELIEVHGIPLSCAYQGQYTEG